MPSSYLFLSEKQREDFTWINLPTISQSSRECYLTVINCKVLLSAGSTANNSLIVKMKIPSLNYFSSDNKDVTVAFLYETKTKSFTLEHENQISILTNDNLKSVEIILEDEDGDVIEDAETNVDSVELMLKLDYIDQDAMANQVVVEYPKRL